MSSRVAWKRLSRAVVAGLIGVPFAAGVALAHPLGNFTINRYAGIRVEPDRVLLDVVIDEAEIPAFQATRAIDLDRSGVVSAAETSAAREGQCRSVGAALSLTADGTPLAPVLVEAGLAFPPGNGGLTTMRIVCAFEAALPSPIGAATRIGFGDAFEAARIGWREVTVAGSGVAVDAPGVPSTSPSRRLTAYPAGLSSAPDVRSVAFLASPGGPVLPAFDVPDAEPVEAAAPGGSPAAPAASSTPSASVTPSAPATGGAPGGEASLPSILRDAPVTPWLALAAMVTAAVLGAGHALTPGHGKTLMAAYLVGTRGTPRHAIGLGLAVSVSHTLGILGLAAVVLAAQSTLPPDVVVRVAPLVAAGSIVVIGGWMLVGELRRMRAGRLPATPDEGHGCPHAHAYAQPQEDAHSHGHAHAHASGGNAGGAHSHGGLRHTHLPRERSAIGWRSLFVLGLAGGLVPSTSALLILLATIAAGRAAWGIVLVAAFGIGMAAVMTGVGLALVHARSLLERALARLRLTAGLRLVPAGAAVVVLAVGVLLTTQALSVVRLG